MMRKVGGALAIAMAADAAGAADFPPYTVTAPIRTYSWTGPYLGGHLGYQWGNTTRNPTQPWGITGGVRGGYNWQTGAFVFGGEAEISASGASDTFASWKFANPWFGAVRGRVGYAFSNVVVFASGGFAFGGGHAELGALSERKAHGGWTVGGGMEVALTSAWSARVEYLYIDLSDRPYALTGTSHGFESSVLRFGINYRF